MGVWDSERGHTEIEAGRATWLGEEKREDTGMKHGLKHIHLYQVLLRRLSVQWEGNQGSTLAIGLGKILSSLHSAVSV